MRRARYSIRRMHGHPLFARFYAWMSPGAESKLHIAEHRDELLQGLSGRALEIGCGNGLNFGHYPEAVSEVVAIEPEPYLRAKAAENAARARVTIDLRAGEAAPLPFPDASFDAAVVSLVLCTVPDPAEALRELHRVVRPGGELRIYEHVLSTEGSRARWQRRIAPVWKVFGGGCHPDRDTEAVIRGAGFQPTVRRLDVGPPSVLNAANPHILGIAVRT